MIKNKELKIDIIETEFDKFVSKLEYEVYDAYKNQDYAKLEVLDDIIDTFDETRYKTAKGLNVNTWKRAQRLRNRIWFMIEHYDPVFITLTFRNDVLVSTSQDTRKRYVERYLKSQHEHYVANIDFGEDYGREHYHALVVGRIDLKKWTYGAINVKVVRKNASSAYKLSKYVAKLTNHALKDTTKQVRIIYSKTKQGLDTKALDQNERERSES